MKLIKVTAMKFTKNIRIEIWRNRKVYFPDDDPHLIWGIVLFTEYAMHPGRKRILGKWRNKFQTYWAYDWTR